MPFLLFCISPTGLLPPAVCLSRHLRLCKSRALNGPQPQIRRPGLGSSPFARRYLGNRCFFLFLRVLRCFSSPGFLHRAYFIQRGITAHYCSWVSPFGHLRIKGHLHLPAAYRSLSRPSSAPSAKASALCSFSLDLSDLPSVSNSDGLGLNLLIDLSVTLFVFWFLGILLKLQFLTLRSSLKLT